MKNLSFLIPKYKSYYYVTTHKPTFFLYGMQMNDVGETADMAISK